MDPFLDTTRSFKLTPLESIVTEHAVLIAGMKDDVLVPMGTAVFVSPRLLLTAAHVLDGLWKEFEYSTPPGQDEQRQSTFVAIAIQWPDRGGNACIWILDKATRCSGTDLMLARVKPGNDGAQHYIWHGCIGMSLDLPPLGARVVAFGYPATEVLSWKSDLARLRLFPTTSVGKVTDVFPESRDRGMLNFPCFQVDARFDGAMSGGPVFDPRGRLCGVVCDGLPVIEGTPHVSNASALWPCLFMDLEFDLPQIAPQGPYQVWELARLGAISAPDWKTIRDRAYIDYDEQGTAVIRLRPAPRAGASLEIVY